MKKQDKVVDINTPLAISCRDISLVFDGLQLFDHLTLDFPAQTCTCILGASGCGKSTLLKMIAGSFHLQYSGTIWVGDAVDQHAQYCAWMGQNDLLLPWLNVLDNVMLGTQLRGEKNARKQTKALQILEAVGLAQYHNALPNSLSGGMRQRVALARTLMEERPVMLMDEPFSALDALTRQKMQNLSAKVTRNRTILLVTHDPLEALRLGDKIVVLGDSPANCIYSVIPKGRPPRNMSEPALQELYSKLLSILLEEK